MDWSIWVTFGIVCLIIELFTTSIVFFCLTIASLVTALAAWCNAALGFQLFIYGISVLISYYWIKPVLQNLFYSSKDAVKTNTEALIGQTGIVLRDILPDTKVGRVMVSGDDWRAVSVDNSPIAAGKAVVVERVESNTLWVKPK